MTTKTSVPVSLTRSIWGHVPVAGVGDKDGRLALDPDSVKLAASRLDHRLKQAAVRRVGRQLGGDDQLSLVVTAWAL